MNPSRSLLHTFIAWLLALGYMAGIFYLSHQPSIPVPMRFEHQDKVVHFCAYFLMAAFLAHAIWTGGLKRRFLWAFLLAALYGVTDEVHQSFVPGREATLGDWAADAAGAWFGALIYLKAEFSYLGKKAKKNAPSRT